MRSLPKPAQIYILTITLAALAVLFYYSLKTDFNYEVLQGLVFFSILAIFAEILKVNLPRGGFVSVTFAVIYTSTLLYSAGVAIYVTIIGIVCSEIITRPKNPWYKLMFNCSQYIICIAVTQTIFILTGGKIGNVSPLDIIPLVVSTGGFFITNVLAITLVLSFVHGISPWSVWITNFKWTLPNMFTLLFLGVLMAGIYHYAGYWGVSLFFGPLLLARFIFKSYMDVRQNYLGTLEALASALDAKDKYTRGHSDRVAKYAVELARQIKLPEDQVEVIQQMALLHDVGKIGISDELLNRSGKISNDEFAMIKFHPVIGADILKDIHYLGAATEFVRYHHEKYDGSGYPDGLKGESIPLGARIITVADSFDAMTSDRSYRKKMTVQEALDEVSRCAGSHFDPLLAEAFLKCWNQKTCGTELSSLVEAASTVDK